MRILAKKKKKKKKEIGLNCSIYFEIDKFFCGIFISTMCLIFVNIHIVLFSMYTYSFEYAYYFYP
jgi:hypothetical protein